MGRVEDVLEKIGTTFRLTETAVQGRSERISRLRVGDPVKLVRQPQNKQDPNTIVVKNQEGSLGLLPPRVTKDLAPLFDEKRLLYKAKISRILPVTAADGKKKTLSVTIDISFKVRGETLETAKSQPKATRTAQMKNFSEKMVKPLQEEAVEKIREDSDTMAEQKRKEEIYPNPNDIEEPELHLEHSEKKRSSEKMEKRRMQEENDPQNEPMQEEDYFEEDEMFLSEASEHGEEEEELSDNEIMLRGIAKERKLWEEELEEYKQQLQILSKLQFIQRRKLNAEIALVKRQLKGLDMQEKSLQT